MVVLTTIVAPILLKITFAHKNKSGGSGKPEETEILYESDLMKNYNQKESWDVPVRAQETSR